MLACPRLIVSKAMMAKRRACGLNPTQLGKDKKDDWNNKQCAKDKYERKPVPCGIHSVHAIQQALNRLFNVANDEQELRRFVGQALQVTI